MKVCSNCFNDEEIKNFIISSSSDIAHCDCCENDDCVIDLSELYDFFIEFTELYCKDENSSTDLIEALNSQWNIFSSEKCAEQILNELYESGIIKYGARDKVRYIDEILECTKVWDKLKEDVTTKSRFFTDITSFEWGSFIQPNDILAKHKLLYRARIVPDGTDRLTPSQMGCPPAHKTTAGRANPLGIPYLYLCDNEQTTLYETRSVYLDRVCIGTFRICRDLNIVNFNNVINPFYAFTDGSDTLRDSIKKRIIIDSICKDLSKPLRRFDTELEYVPTQLICEYCKLNQADGIMFASSLHPDGQNIVLFDPKDAKCTKVDYVEISKVAISSTKL